MPFDSMLSMRSQLQLASRTLPSSEQYQLGGANYVRGYPEGDYLADMGVNLSTDWSFPMYFIPKDYKLPHADMPLRHQIEPGLFVDAGWGKLIKKMATEESSKFLVCAGGGLKLNFNEKMNARLDWAQHFGDSPISGMGPSTFTMSFQFEL